MSAKINCQHYLYSLLTKYSFRYMRVNKCSLLFFIIIISSICFFFYDKYKDKDDDLATTLKSESESDYNENKIQNQNDTNEESFEQDVTYHDKLYNDHSWKYKPHICKDIIYTVTVKPRDVPLIYHESKLAHQLLDELRGVEIGASAHNPYGLKNSIKVDYSCNDTWALNNQFAAASTFIKVDIAAPADQLPFADASLDYVVASYVIEHLYDPIKTMKEWLRVVRKNGYVFIAAPHQQRNPQDQQRERTKLEELIDRHEHPKSTEFSLHEHYSVWITQDFLELCLHFNWTVVAVQDTDEKLNVGFTVVIKK